MTSATQIQPSLDQISYHCSRGIYIQNLITPYNRSPGISPPPQLLHLQLRSGQTMTGSPTTVVSPSATQIRSSRERILTTEVVASPHHRRCSIYNSEPTIPYGRISHNHRHDRTPFQLNQEDQCRTHGRISHYRRRRSTPFWLDRRDPSRIHGRIFHYRHCDPTPF